MQQKIFDLLLEQEEISWKTIIYDLVKSEEMDPWDINITLLTQKYIQVIKEMKEHDFRISGKILLAAAILLKLKSTHLIDNDISKLDQLINSTEEEIIEEEFLEGISSKMERDKNKYQLVPRNPQPRNRKVSIQDLVNALQKAMESKRRLLERTKPIKFTMPQRNMDILEVIKDVYNKVIYYSKKEKEKITFTRLLPPRAGKQEKVHTFIPLLHLENQERVEMTQPNHFEEIHITLTKKKTEKA